MTGRGGTRSDSHAQFRSIRSAIPRLQMEGAAWGDGQLSVTDELSVVAL